MATYKFPTRSGSKLRALGQISASINSAKGNAPTYNPFGPDMADSVFGVYYYGESESVCSEEAYPQAELDDADLFDGELHSYHFQWQGELEIESQEELEARLRHRIKKFEHAHNAMCHHALKWHYLMEDVENNPQIKKMFQDMQLMRKLSGTQHV